MLNALFYPGKVPFDSLFIPWIYKEIYQDGIYNDITNGRKDMTIMDVGANIGVVTQYLRNFAKKVYAIEPASEHFEALKKNIEFNKWDNVEAFNMALADKDGEMELHIADDNRTCHSLNNIAGTTATEKVKTMTFETFFKQNKIKEVDFVKFDVEGAEESILMSPGFVQVADRIKAIEIEFHYPNWRQLVDHLIKLGFTARRYESSAIIVLFHR